MTVRITFDTDSYSGNFETELISWVTGLSFEGGHSEDFCQVAREEIPENILAWFAQNNAPVPHEDMPSWLIPGQMCETPGLFREYVSNGEKYSTPIYNSVEVSFREMPPGEVLALMEDRAKFFFRENCKGGELEPVNPMVKYRKPEERVTLLEIRAEQEV